MPPEEEKVRPSQDEVALLRQWIEAGAPDFQPAVICPPLPVSHRGRATVRTDLETFGERDRRFIRYFHPDAPAQTPASPPTNSRATATACPSWSIALSWGPRVVVPKAVDPAGTLFRIDLRDYQWNEKVWDSILAVNPYGRRSPDAAAKEAAGWTGSALLCPG